MGQGNPEVESSRVVYLMDPVIPVWVYVLWFVSQTAEWITEQKVFTETNRYLSMNGYEKVDITSVDYAVKMLKSKGLVDVEGELVDGTLIPTRVRLRLTDEGEKQVDQVWNVIHDTHTLMGGDYF